jgi:4-amino-4-deoxy-L-arabinose transferase-like glycosyltransferase
MERRYQLIVLAVAAAVFLGTAVSPPGLMDDVDAVQARIAQNMLSSGDWVTARLNGVAYLEKSPLIYWLMGSSFAVFGPHDWAARIPLAISSILLCWITARFAAWAFGAATGLAAGLTIATCTGLWLFTRIQIPDAMLTLTITIAMWALLRALEGESRWASIGAAAIGAGLLLKGLIAAVFPLAAIFLFLLVTGEWRSWRKLRPISGLAIILLIAAPWHIAAMAANPPWFDWTWRSVPGEYHGFFWFYFLNEHVFRFLNMRHPRDYNTVPRMLFWAFHLLWLFPWSGALLGAARIPSSERGRRTIILALAWLGFILVFFSFSTTQEYYSMPAYPAFALLIGAAIANGHRLGLRIAGGIFAIAGAAIVFLLSQVWNLPAPGDISQALTQNPEAYTLSLGHMGDLTIASFAYLKAPLMLALLASLAGAAALRYSPLICLPAAMILFLHAARLALTVFDPYLGSRDLALELKRQPPGEVVIDNQYYAFSSVFFYADLDRAWLLNGRINNLEYGSYAPGAPDVFLDDASFAGKWKSAARVYLFVEKPRLEAVRSLVSGRLTVVRELGGKYLCVNQP